MCNVFFYHCNMKCCYCHNHQVIRNNSNIPLKFSSSKKIIQQIIKILNQGITTLGFVSPSHMVPQMCRIINTLHHLNYFPTIVFNTNSYDRSETLREIAPLVDVYLADFKYADPLLAQELSAAADYPQAAIKAISEMVAQKGCELKLDQEGRATNGLIIRHLILPGYVKSSINVLRTLAHRFSPRIHISLMSQYYPTPFTRDHPTLKRTITQSEYDQVVKELTTLGFENGWIQELNNTAAYRPDFRQDHPFEY